METLAILCLSGIEENFFWALTPDTSRQCQLIRETVAPSLTLLISIFPCYNQQIY